MCSEDCVAEEHKLGEEEEEEVGTLCYIDCVYVNQYKMNGQSVKGAVQGIPLLFGYHVIII